MALEPEKPVAPAGDAGKPAADAAAAAAAAAAKPAGDAIAAKPAGETLLAAGVKAAEAGKPVADGKAAADGKGEEAGKEGGEGKPQEPAGIPEVYTVNLPEGMEADEELLDEVAPLAQEAKLTQAQFDKFAEAYLKAQERTNQKIQATIAGWADQARKDPELGGADFDKNLAIAQKTIRLLGTPALVELLNSRGLGNHPELIRFCYRLGMKVADDTTEGAGGGGGGAGQQTPESKLYGKVDVPQAAAS